jgi:hypothetical protein
VELDLGGHLCRLTGELLNQNSTPKASSASFIFAHMTDLQSNFALRNLCLDM